MKEGDAYNAANTNAEIDDAIADVNSLTFAENVRPRSLTRHHMRSLLEDDEAEEKNNGRGFSVDSDFANWSTTQAFRQYSNEIAPTGAHPKNFQTVAGIGPGAGVGWRLLSTSAGSVANMCQVRWPAAGSTWANYNSVLISASVCIGLSATAGQMLPTENCFALSLVIEDSAGNYYCVPRTIRFFNATTSAGERLSLTALLFPSDLVVAANTHGGSANVRRVILAFGRLDPTQIPPDAIAGVGYIEVGPFNITQMPLKHGTLA
tara:strand:- start:949 stop:1737 length:789 start_codon:yes stop_codon:yes gene_type:complete